MMNHLPISLLLALSTPSASAQTDPTMPSHNIVWRCLLAGLFLFWGVCLAYIWF